MHLIQAVQYYSASYTAVSLYYKPNWVKFRLNYKCTTKKGILCLRSYKRELHCYKFARLRGHAALLILMKVKDVLKTTDIIKVKPEDTLNSALSLLKSSHDAAFVFDGDTFLGVVNPYHALIQKSYPANTKVKNSLIHPPKLKMSDSLQRAGQLMNESKLHYLPVFENSTFKGIVSARRIMKSMLKNVDMNTKIEQILKKRKKLITIDQDSYLTKALNQFKDKKISKLVTVDKKGTLKGVLAYYDIIDYLTMPKQRQNYASRQGSKTSTMKKAVKNFHKQHVLTVGVEETLQDAVQKMIDNTIGSVVLIDSSRKPVGIITTKDVLKSLDNHISKSLVTIHGKSLSKASQSLTETFSQSLETALQKAKGVIGANVMVKEKKQGGVFEAAVSILKDGAKGINISAEGKDLAKLLQDIRKKTKRLIQS